MLDNIYTDIFKNAIAELVHEAYTEADVYSILMHTVSCIWRLPDTEFEELISSHKTQNAGYTRECLSNPKTLYRHLDAFVNKSELLAKTITLRSIMCRGNNTNDKIYTNAVSEYISNNDDLFHSITYNVGGILSSSEAVYDLSLFLVILKGLSIHNNRSIHFTSHEEFLTNYDQTLESNKSLLESIESVAAEGADIVASDTPPIEPNVLGDSDDEEVSYYMGYSASISDSSTSLMFTGKVSKIVNNMKCTLSSECSSVIIACLKGNLQDIKRNIDDFFKYMSNIKGIDPSIEESYIISSIVTRAVKILLISDAFDINNLNEVFQCFRDHGLFYISDDIQYVGDLYNRIRYSEREYFIESFLEASFNITDCLIYAALRDIKSGADNNKYLNDTWTFITEKLNPNGKVRQIKDFILHHMNMLHYDTVSCLNWCESQLINDGIVNAELEVMRTVYAGWMSGRSLDCGVYYFNKITEGDGYVFGIVQKNSTDDVEFTANWMMEQTNHIADISALVEAWEMILDVSVHKMRYSAIREVFARGHQEFINNTDTYIWSRLVATAVIRNAREIFDIFWEATSNIESENHIRKRAIVDSTWAFHHALRTGNHNMANLIYSKIDELSGDDDILYRYKYDLLYGLDLYAPRLSLPEASAFVSMNIDVLRWVHCRAQELLAQYETMKDRVDRVPGARDADACKAQELSMQYKTIEYRLSDAKKDERSTMLRNMENTVECINLPSLAVIPCLYSNDNFISQVKENFLNDKQELLREFNDRASLTVRQLKGPQDTSQVLQVLDDPCVQPSTSRSVMP